MYLETGKSPITDEDEFHLPPPILETCYNCFEKDLQTTKLIDVKNLKPFLFHLFRTDNKVLEDEEIKIHFIFEYNKLSNTFNTFFLNDDTNKYVIKDIEELTDLDYEIIGRAFIDRLYSSYFDKWECNCLQNFCENICRQSESEFFLKSKNKS